MNIFGFIVKSAFITGVLTTGAFFTGAALGTCIKKDKLVDGLKKMQIKKNPKASID